MPISDNTASFDIRNISSFWLLLKLFKDAVSDECYLLTNYMRGWMRDPWIHRWRQELWKIKHESL